MSQIAISTAWGEARYGTTLNVVVALAAVYGAFAWGPFGLRAEYQGRAAAARAALAGDRHPITEAELAPLPGPVQRYLRYVGAVGQPHVRAFRATFRGRIRGGPDQPWMPLTGEQQNTVEPSSRLFWMVATRGGVPIDGLHAYEGGAARMRVKLLSMVPVVDTCGPAFSRTETVTVLNDLCIFAPPSLVDAPIRWRELDERRVEATFTVGPHTVSAVLVFGEDGALIDFWSDDRPALAPDGVTFLPQRWSTPVGDYQVRRGYRLVSRGEARYAAPGGVYTYIEFDGLDVFYDVR